MFGNNAKCAVCGFSARAPVMVLGWNEHEPATVTSTSVGEFLGGAEAKIVNEDGTDEVPVGQPGELWSRGPNIMKGYWGNTEATKQTLTEDKWLKTGDIAYVDAMRRFYILDRKKELIKVRGNQVAPAELEALLLEHPLIFDVAVIGCRIDEEECPRAYVVSQERSSLTEKEVVQFVEARVAKVKRITGGVVFVDSIPKNPSGKILRRILRDRAESELKHSRGELARL